MQIAFKKTLPTLMIMFSSKEINMASPLHILFHEKDVETEKTAIRTTKKIGVMSG